MIGPVGAKAVAEKTLLKYQLKSALARVKELERQLHEQGNRLQSLVFKAQMYDRLVERGEIGREDKADDRRRI